MTSTGTTGVLKREDAPSFTGSISGPAGPDAIDIADISPVTVANGATVEIDGPSMQSVTRLDLGAGGHRRHPHCHLVSDDRNAFFHDARGPRSTDAVTFFPLK